jgi:threonine dehydratase
MTVNPDTIAAAHARIAPYIRRTPVVDIVQEGMAKPVALKLELLQHAGSFKPRGAFNNLVGAAKVAGGVAAASGGNHGAAVAYASQVLGHKARIFVPEISSPAKVARIASYGAEIVQQGPTYYEAAALCEDYIKATGALSVHAYNTEATLAGQGTLAKEFEEQAPDVDTVLVAVGGGGLIGGVAAWYQSRVKVVAVEPVTSDALHAALKAGYPVDVAPSGIAADSLGARSAGTLMFPIAQQHIAAAILVSDDDIRAAQAYLWRTLQLVTEPGGATAFAALLSGAYRPAKGERLGIVVCGANTTMEAFAKVL